MSDALESLNGLIVPLAGQPLLLPNVAVAELVGYRLSQPATQGPDWFLGWATWRDQKVPLIDPERLLGQTPTLSATIQPRTLVLNALGGRPGLNFIGLRVWSIPRSRKVIRGEIEPAGEASLFITQPVTLAGGSEVLLIPDLLAMEKALSEAGVLRG
ncbi:MAG TPA: chemotaxis protein CheW [Pseudomonas xinjiangensis]|uniref:Chemotaxis protein CheW n=2 Tax=root TaxID=1 RepID=A0A7V1BQM4_9GAMM|nr:chemotaxis protein CheW [Halopseudomonas xinjiangensis]HEC47926.1 chemotaxis protein CheW [Halopseudomonas xinjiangensis]